MRDPEIWMTTENIRSAQPPPPPPTSGQQATRVARAAQEVEQLTDELLAALHRYRVAKRVYAARTAVIEKLYGQTAKADIEARDDYRRARAVSDCTWYRGEVMAASNALLALRSLAGGGRP